MVTGDWMRSSSSHLEKVINAGVRTVVYAGDADYICNYQGIENMVNALRHKYSSQYASTPWTSWTVDGVTTGQFKNAGPLSYVRFSRFVSHLQASRFKLTSSSPGLAISFPPLPSETCHMEDMLSPCSTRRWLANRSLRRSPKVNSENYTQLSIVISIMM